VFSNKLNNDCLEKQQFKNVENELKFNIVKYFSNTDLQDLSVGY